MPSTTAVPSATASFVEQLYTRFLHRAADAGGVAYWAGKIDSGALNAAQVSAQFMASTEFQQTVDPVVRLYFAAFGRIPDAAGVSFWADAMRTGPTPQQLGAGFAGGPEFRALYGAVDNGAFLDTLYQNAFQRAPDAAGKAFYLEQMSHGLSRSDIVVAFSSSPEMRDTMGATVRVVEQYLGAHQAAPSAAQVAAGLASTDPVALITKLYASDQYSGAAVPFLSRAGVVADGYIKGATVTMTTHESVNGVTTTRVETRITDAKGMFDFGEHAGFGDLVQTGGIDISTGAAVNGSFRAVAGSTVINPLTALLQAIAADGKHSAAEAEALVKAKLGIDASVELGSYNPIAELAKADTGAAAQAIALKVQSALAQINTAMGQIGAVLGGAGVSGLDAGANAAVKAIAGMIVGAAASVDLGAASTATQLLKDAGAAAGASASQAAAVAAIAADAGTAIGNLNHAIADAAGAAGGDAQSHLVAIARVQVAGEAIETGMASGAHAGDLSASASATGAGPLAALIVTAAAHVGVVNGDGKSDAVLPPPPPPPNFAVTVSAGGDAYINAMEAGAATGLTVGVTSSTLGMVTVSGKASDDSALSVTATRHSGTSEYVFDATAFKDGTLSVVAADIYGQTKTFNVTLDKTAPEAVVTTVAFSADTGVTTDLITRTAIQNLSGAYTGAIAAGETLEISLNGGATWTAATTAANGDWTLTGQTLAASDTLQARVTDTAGNGSAALSRAYVLDTTATAALHAATDDVGWVTGVVQSGGVTNDTALVLDGTNEFGAQVDVYDGATLLGAATVTGSTWHYVATVADATTYHFNAKETDVAGNTSAATADYTVTGDTTAPDIVDGPTFTSATISLTVREAGRAGLYRDGLFVDSAATMTAGEPNTINVSAQDHVTETVLAVADAAGNLTTHPAKVFLGSDAGDMINGTVAADIIFGFDGSDVITGGAGNDLMTGGTGADTFVFNSVVSQTSDSHFNSGLDSIADLTSEDLIRVSMSNVSAFDASSSDNVVTNRWAGQTLLIFDASGEGDANFGNAGNLIIGIGAYNSAAAATQVVYHITGTAGADVIVGGHLNDTVTGGAGNDTIAGGAGSDLLTGGAGADTFAFNSVVSQSSDSHFNSGLDSIVDMTGEDLIRVSMSNVSAFDASSSNNVITDRWAGQTLLIFDASGEADSNFGNAGNLIIGIGTYNSATAATQVVYDITGTAGADVIVGGGHNDTVTGGAGSDLLTGGAGADTFVFNAVVSQSSDSHFNSGPDSIVDLTSGDLIRVNMSNVSAFDAGSSNNVITNRWAGQTLLIFDASGEADSNFGNAGNLIIGIGTYDSATAATQVVYNITGTAGADVIVGGHLNDTVTGGAGADVLTGGTGADTFEMAYGTSDVGDTIIDFSHDDVLSFTGARDINNGGVVITEVAGGPVSVIFNGFNILIGITALTTSAADVEAALMDSLEHSPGDTFYIALNVIDVDTAMAGDQAGAVVMRFVANNDTQNNGAYQMMADELTQVVTLVGVDVLDLTGNNFSFTTT